MTQAVKQAVSTAFTRLPLIHGMQQAASAMQGLESWEEVHVLPPPPPPPPAPAPAVAAPGKGGKAAKPKEPSDKAAHA